MSRSPDRMEVKTIFLPSAEIVASAFCPPKVSCFKFWRCVSCASADGRGAGSSALAKRELVAINKLARTGHTSEFCIIGHLFWKSLGGLYLKNLQMSLSAIRDSS